MFERPKINEKETGVGPFKNNIHWPHTCVQSHLTKCKQKQRWHFRHCARSDALDEIVGTGQIRNRLSRKHCDQIERILKVLSNICSYKGSPKYLVTFWAFWKSYVLRKTASVYFLSYFWVLFIPTSGHTGPTHRLRVYLVWFQARCNMQWTRPLMIDTCRSFFQMGDLFFSFCFCLFNATTKQTYSKLMLHIMPQTIISCTTTCSRMQSYHSNQWC